MSAPKQHPVPTDPLDSQKRNINQFYTIGSTLGSGSFSEVKKAVRKTDGKEFAVKWFKKNKNTKLHLLDREIKIMQQLKHPHVLPLIDVFEDDSAIYLVLQLATGGELFDKIMEIGNYSEKEAASIVKQILEAVQYLHEKGVAHRDLKPENLLCSSDFDTTKHIYVADFGLSRFFQAEEQLTTYCGSPEYVAPEVLLGTPYACAVDLWSIGVIAYILLTGFLPFYDKNHTVLFDKIKKVDYNWQDCPEVSEMAKRFIEGLLVADPKRRLTATQALNHPWIKGDGSSRPIKSSSFRDFVKTPKTPIVVQPSQPTAANNNTRKKA